MPLYEYRCHTCRKSFEMLRRMTDVDREVECPECRSAEVERLLSTFATSGCGTSMLESSLDRGKGRSGGR